MKRWKFWLTQLGMWSAALGLVMLRYRFRGSDSLGNLAMAIAMIPQFWGYQKFFSPRQPEDLVRGLEWSQWGWFLFAGCSPGEGPLLGSVGFLVGQMLIKAPLQNLLDTAGLRNRFLVLLGLLATVGCLPFSTFSSYFQTFLPLMGVGAGVTTMTQKLYTGAGLWAVVVMLSVVYQSCALGYFYWDKIMNGEVPKRHDHRIGVVLAWMGLICCAALGLWPGLSGYVDVRILKCLGISIQ